MTIIEAVKSGKPFRLPNSALNFQLNWHTKGWIDYSQLLRIDWEILICEEHGTKARHALKDSYICYKCSLEYMEFAEGPDECYSYYGPLITLDPVLEKKFKEITIIMGDASGGPGKAGCDSSGKCSNPNGCGCECDESKVSAGIDELCDGTKKEVTVPIPISWKVSKCQCGGNIVKYTGLKETFEHCNKCGEKK